jgi:hypothetical protein
MRRREGLTRSQCADGALDWVLFPRRYQNVAKIGLLSHYCRVSRREGVESRRAAPKARTRQGEGIVQTKNEPKARTRPGEAAKAVAGMKIPRLERAVPVQVRPPAPI